MPYASLTDFQPQRRYSRRLGQYFEAPSQSWTSIPVLLPSQPFPKTTLDWYYYGELAMSDAGAQMVKSIGAERCPYWLTVLASYRPERGIGKAGFTNVRDLKNDFVLLFNKLATIDPNVSSTVPTPARLAAIRNVQEIYFAGLKRIQGWSREDIVVQKALLDKTWWFNTQPWMKDCRCASPFPWTNPWIDWMVGYMAQKNDPAAFPEPPRPPVGSDWEYNAYIQVMSRAFGIGYIPEPAANDSRYAVYKQAVWIVMHPPIGFFARIGRFFRKFLSIIITVVGIVLSPLTAGVSNIAAAVVNSAMSTVAVVKAAQAAKAQAAANAAALKAEADKQIVNVVTQVNKFYTDNPQWFFQHGMIPEKWITLTLDQKIEFITAGAEGRLPVGTESVLLSAEDQEKQLKDQALAAQKVGLKPESVLPAEVGGTVMAPRGVVPPPLPSGSPMTYDVVIEGRNIGTYNTLDAANQAALDNTNRGDRFEIVAGGTPTGLQVRTVAGPIAIPPEAKAEVESISKGKMLNVVNKAEQRVMQQDESGGFPWWALIAAGAAAVASR